MHPAGWYEEVSNASLRCLREGELIRIPRRLKELEVQARWFSGEFGTEFVTTSGARVKVLQLGVWNREAGPDFAEAAISINGGEPLRGCIELDPEVRDWEHHGHSTNPDYESVVLHLFWKRPTQEAFTRTAGNRCVPQVLLDLRELEEGKPSTQPLAKPGRCSSVLRGISETKAREIIEAAAQFRLGKKAARLARLAEIHGPDEALYQALAIALGYKSNKLPFALLSQRLPLGLLQKNKSDADALMFGVAGFIDSTDLSAFDSETRAYLRRLWGKWWARRIEFQRIALARDEWRFSGLRPANDPHRRVAALLEITKSWPQIRALAKSCLVAPIRKFFSNLGEIGCQSGLARQAGLDRQCGLDRQSGSDFWAFHYSFTSARSEKSMALVGDSRVNELLANVFFPFAILSDPSLWNSFKELRATLSNRRVEIAAIRLFGDDAPHKLFLKSVAHQQGLLQIYEDFCTRDASDCARCPFPEQCVDLPMTFKPS